MRIYYVRGVAGRRRPPAALILSAVILVAACSWFVMGLGRLLPSWPSLRVEWAKYILTSILPLPAAAPKAVAWSDGWSPQRLQPRGWLEAQMPILTASRGGGDGTLPVLARPVAEGEEEVEPLPPPEAQNPAEEQNGAGTLLTNAEVQVFVYTTHNAESYVPDYGAAKAPGEQGGVTKVAAALVAALENQGVRAVLSPAMHDYPDFNLSYYNSERTVKRALAQYPSLRLIVDVHRDAGADKPVTATIAGEKAARIVLVVGTNNRLPHPDWRRNLAFANKIEAKMEELYPGLCKGVYVQNGRYNQHLSSHAILVEMGNDLNTLDEAQTSAGLLARVLKEVM